MMRARRRVSFLVDMMMMRDGWFTRGPRGRKRERAGRRSGSELNVLGYREYRMDDAVGGSEPTTTTTTGEGLTGETDARRLFYSTSRVGDADHGGETMRENARVFWR